MRVLSFRQRQWLAILLLMILAAVIFLPGHGAEFLLWDDDLHLTKNPFFHPLNGGSWIRIWTTPYPEGPALYIPLTYSLWGALVLAVQSFWGADWAAQNVTAPFLAFNFSLHLANAFLVYQVLKNIFQKASRETLLVAALLFLFHPLQLESVVWISGLKETLWATFALLTLWAHLRGQTAWVFIALLLALLTKPTAVVIPLMILVFEGRTRPRPRWLYLTMLFVLAAPFAFLAASLQPPSLVQSDMTWLFRPVVAWDALGFYLQKIFWPLNLGPDYGRTPVWLFQHFPTLELLWPFVALVVLFFLARRFREPRPLLLAAALFVIPLLPVLGLVPFQFQNFSTVADRYCYLPLVGLSVLAVFVQMHFSRAKAVLAFFIAVLAFLSFQGTENWRSNESFFTHALEVNPESNAAEVDLGFIFSAKGQWSEALQHFERAYELSPGNAVAASNVGVLLMQLGENDKALAHYAQVVKQTPGNFDAHLGYASLLKKLGREDEARSEWEMARSLDPTNPIFKSH